MAAPIRSDPIIDKGILHQASDPVGALDNRIVVIVLLVRHRLFTTVPVRSHKITSGDGVVEVFGRGTIESRREVQRRSVTLAS